MQPQAEPAAKTTSTPELDTLIARFKDALLPIAQEVFVSAGYQHDIIAQVAGYEQHRVQLNRKFGCISSNLLILLGQKLV